MTLREKLKKDQDDVTINSTTGFSIFYRSLWIFMTVLGIAWGIFIGLSLSGKSVLGTSTLATGTVVLLGLFVTLFVAGRSEPH